MLKHLEISKKYFIQSPALLKLKAEEEKVEKVDGLKGIEKIEIVTIRDKESDSDNEKETERGGHREVPNNVLANKEEDEVDEKGDY